MQQCFILEFRLLVHRALPRLDTTSEVRAGLAMYGPVHKKDAAEFNFYVVNFATVLDVD